MRAGERDVGETGGFLTGAVPCSHLASPLGAGTEAAGPSVCPPAVCRAGARCIMCRDTGSPGELHLTGEDTETTWVQACSPSPPLAALLGTVTCADDMSLERPGGLATSHSRRVPLTPVLWGSPGPAASCLSLVVEQRGGSTPLTSSPAPEALPRYPDPPEDSIPRTWGSRLLGSAWSSWL